jgi:hypothetical protein
VATEEAYFVATLATPPAQTLSEEEQADFKVLDVLPVTEVELPPAKPPPSES